MPHHDPVQPGPLPKGVEDPWLTIEERRLIRLRSRRKGRRGKDGDLQPEPVKPDKPKPLEGGAAAPLEFDD